MGVRKREHNFSRKEKHRREMRRRNRKTARLVLMNLGYLRTRQTKLTKVASKKRCCWSF